MFTVYHFLWLGVSAALIAGALWLLRRRRPPLQRVLSVCCALSVASELVKALSVVEMVPSSDGSMLLPYIELQHLPLHLCSIQILLIFYARFARPGRGRTAVLAFMYPTCLIGAVLALAMPSIFSTSLPASQAFAHPLAYQFFLYHSMLVVLGAYIPCCGEVELRPRHYFSTLGLLGALALLSLYLNSMFAAATYEDGELVSVEYATNFFFTYKPPLPIPLTSVGQWLAYLAVICLLAVALVGLCYLPVFLHARKKAAAG